MKNTTYLVFLALVMTLVSCSGDEGAVVGETEVRGQVESGEDVIGLNVMEPKISYCLPRYMSDGETRTIWEVLTGEEVTYGQLTLRSNEKKRGGMYFFVMFDWEPDSILLGSRFELSVSASDDPRERTFTFIVPETSSVLREVALGITGKDWPNSSAKVNAWKLVLKSPSGKILAEKKSWLWSATDKQGYDSDSPLK